MNELGQFEWLSEDDDDVRREEEIGRGRISSLVYNRIILLFGAVNKKGVREEEGEPSDAEILMMMIFNCLPEHNEGYPVLSGRHKL